MHTHAMSIVGAVEDRVAQSTARRGVGLIAAVLGVIATVLSGVGIGRPSLWWDEAATISGANRSWSSWAHLVTHNDPAHPVYYAFMHVWVQVLGLSETAVRAPSVLATGLTTAGVVVLTMHLTGDRMSATAAGVVCAVLPRMTWAAIEARPYALSAAAAVWTTVALVRAARTGRGRDWTLYAAAVLLGVATHLFVVTMLAVHALAVVLVGELRTARRGFVLTAVPTVGVMVPYLVHMAGGSALFNWVPAVGPRTIVEVGVFQYFDRSVVMALACVVIVASTLVVRRSRSAARDAVVLGLVWMAVPTVAVLLYSLHRPVYVDRYLSFTIAGCALTVGVSVVHLMRRRVVVAVTLTVLALLAAPSWLQQRGPYAKYDSAYGQVAALVAAQSRPGDCVVIDPALRWRPRPATAILAAYPSAFAGRRLVNTFPVVATRDALFDGLIDPRRTLKASATCTVVLTITNPPGGIRSPATALASQGGLVVERTWDLHRTRVIRSTRDG
jgi:mannosyltransferase